MAWARRLPSGRWQGLYRDPADKVRSTGTFARKSDVKKAAQGQEDLIPQHRWVDPTSSKTPFEVWAKEVMLSIAPSAIKQNSR